MKISIIKASGTMICRNKDCEEKPEFIQEGRIVKGSTCAKVVFQCAAGGAQSFYCRDCLDKVYLHVKESLNSKLWAFQ